MAKNEVVNFSLQKTKIHKWYTHTPTKITDGLHQVSCMAKSGAEPSKL